MNREILFRTKLKFKRIIDIDEPESYGNRRNVQ